MSVEATLATWRLPKSKVTSTEKLFLLACANRAGEAHECWPSVKRISADTGLERKTILKARQSVIDKKLLEYSGEFKGRSGQIPVMRLTYVDDSLSEFTSTKNGTSPKNGTGTCPKNGTGDQSQKRDTESKRENLKEEVNNTPKSSQEECVFFEKFWTLYPVKSAKKACLQKWKRKNLKSIAEDIISKVNLQLLNDRKWLAGYAPNPLTYLNQERWTDELDMRPGGTTGKQQSTNSFYQTIAKYNKRPKEGCYDEYGNFVENYL